MDFSMITNMNSYLKTGAQKHTWMQKALNPTSSGTKPTGAAAQGTENNDQKQGVLGMLESLQRQTEGQDARLSGIISKMQSGQDLSPGDLEYLRKASPEAYEKAVKLMREKEEYERELRNCKTRDEARSLQLSKVSEALSTVKMGQEAGDVATCIEANSKLNLLSAVFTEFTQTSEYEDMAATALELAEALEAERQQSGEVAEPEDVPAEEEPAAEAEPPRAETEPPAETNGAERADGPDGAPQNATATPDADIPKQPGGKPGPKKPAPRANNTTSSPRATAPEANPAQQRAVRHVKGYGSSAGFAAPLPEPTFSSKA